MGAPRDWFPADSRLSTRTEILRARRDPVTRQASAVWYHILALAKRCKRDGLLADAAGPMTNEDIAADAGVVVPAECFSADISADTPRTPADICGQLADMFRTWGWLTRTDKGWKVTNWAGWNGDADAAMDAVERRKAADRERKRAKRDAQKDVGPTSSAASSSADISADTSAEFRSYTDTDTDTDTDQNKGASAQSADTSKVLDAEIVDDAPAAKPKRTRAPKDSTPEPEIPEWVPADAWAAFDDSRRRGKAKATWTANARGLALAKLARLRDEGNDPREVLEQSVLNGYPGLWPVRRGGGQSALPLSGRASVREARAHQRSGADLFEEALQAAEQRRRDGGSRC